MNIKIDTILNQQGKSRNWLAQQTGITYYNLSRLCKNQTTSIQFDILTRLCKVLECTPNDILDLTEEKSTETP